MTLTVRNVRGVDAAGQAELDALLVRVHYPDPTPTKLPTANMITVEDVVTGRLVGALTYRTPGPVLWIGRFVTDGPSPRERYQVMQVLLRWIAFIAQFEARAHEVRISMNTGTIMYPTMVKLLRRHGFTDTQPERTDYKVWARAI